MLQSHKSWDLPLVEKYQSNNLTFALRGNHVDQPKVLSFCSGRGKHVASIAGRLFDPITVDPYDKSKMDRLPLGRAAQLIIDEGEEAYAKVDGEFVSLLFNTETSELQLATDALGTRPLYISEHKDFVAFCSAIPPLLKLPWISKNINDQALCDYIFQYPYADGQTFYSAIKRVPAAHIFIFNRKQSRQKRYWSLDVKEPLINMTKEQIIVQLKQLVEDSISRRIAGNGEVATELSGGLDSSLITAIAAQKLAKNNRQLTSLSHINPDTALAQQLNIKDELKEIKHLLTQYPEVKAVFIDDQKVSFVEAEHQALDIQGGPHSADLNGRYPQLLNTCQQQGITTLLSGFGGDEVISSPGLSRVYDYAQMGQWRKIWQLYAGAKYSLRFKISSLAKLIIWRITGRRIKATYGRKSRTWQVFSSIASPKLLSNSHYPKRLAKLQQGSDINCYSRLAEKIQLESNWTLTRTCESALHAARWGVFYSYPLLDRRLICFFNRIPTAIKHEVGQSRQLMRDILKGIVPDAIRLREDKSGNIVPAALHNIVKEQDKIISILNNANKQAHIGQRLDLKPLLVSLQAGLNKTGRYSCNPRMIVTALCIVLWLEKNYHNVSTSCIEGKDKCSQ